MTSFEDFDNQAAADTCDVRWQQHPRLGTTNTAVAATTEK
jgi:hypothetical protein